MKTMKEFDKMLCDHDGIVEFTNGCAITDARLNKYYIYKPGEYLDHGTEVDFQAALSFYNENLKLAKISND